MSAQPLELWDIPFVPTVIFDHLTAVSARIRLAMAGALNAQPIQPAPVVAYLLHEYGDKTSVLAARTARKMPAGHNLRHQRTSPHVVKVA